MNKIEWDSSINIFDTHLIGYLNAPWSFEETVSRLITLSGQAAKSCDCYKVSVEFVGMFNGKVFTLYDYKCDRTLHIGGTSADHVPALRQALTRRLRRVAPTPYSAREYYKGKRTYHRFEPKRKGTL